MESRIHLRHSSLGDLEILNFGDINRRKAVETSLEIGVSAGHFESTEEVIDREPLSTAALPGVEVLPASEAN